MQNTLSMWVVVGMMVSPVGADVTVIRSMENDGISGFGASKHEMTTWIAGDKHREESKSDVKPSMMERLSGAGRPVITRLDKKLRWTLNLPKKTYTESPLVMPSQNTTSESDPSAEEPVEKSKPTIKITKAEIKVTPLNQKKNIGMFVCEGYTLRAILETEDLETHARNSMRMVTTLWTTPEINAVAQLKKEEMAYSTAYFQAIGVTDPMRADLKTLGLGMVASLAGAGEKELSSALVQIPIEMKKIKGYPISTRVEWYGPAEDAPPAAAAEETPEIPTSVGDAFGGFAAHLAKNKLTAHKPAATADGQLLMAMTSTVQSIAITAIPSAQFEVPAGFKKGH